MTASAPQLTLRPLEPRDAAELLRIHRTPEVARWWDAPEEGFPLSDDPAATRLTIEVDGAVAGLVQYSEEPTPAYKHAQVDLFLDPAFTRPRSGDGGGAACRAPPDR